MVRQFLDILPFDKAKYRGILVSLPKNLHRTTFKPEQEGIAEAEAITRISAAIQGSQMPPANYMLADKYISTLKEMVSGKDNKTVYLPYDASSVLSSIGCIKDLFNK